MKKKAELIDKILKRHKNEWLLIDVDKMDERTLKPKTGKLVGHSQRKKDLFKAMKTYKGRLYSIYSGPVLPPGVRAVFGYSVMGRPTLR